MSNNRTTEQEVRFAAYKEVRGRIGAQNNKSEAVSEEALDVYNGKDRKLTKSRATNSQINTDRKQTSQNIVLVHIG